MLGRNVLVGLIASFWTAALGLAVVPLYLKLLGVEAYGLIGFFATTQVMFQLLDMGLTPTLSREIARHAAGGRSEDGKNLLHTLAGVFWVLAALIALVGLLAAPTVATRWLQARDLAAGTVQDAVALLGVVIACRWPIGLYQAALAGAQRMAVASVINIVGATLASGGAVLILAFVSPTIEAFFAWQATAGLTHALLMRRAAWSSLGSGGHGRFDPNALRRVWRFSAGMSIVAVLGVVLTQMDKVLLSRLLDLRSYGHYMLAAVVVGGLTVVVAPIFNAIYPRLSGLVASDDLLQLRVVYRLGKRTLGALLFPMAMFVAVCAEDLVTVWTGNPSLAAEVAPLITVMAAGSALHGIVHLPHALQLAHGRVLFPIIINIVLVLLFLPLLVVLVGRYGALGGAFGWLGLNVAYLVLTFWLTGRYVLEPKGAGWIDRDVLVPALLAVGAGALLHLLVDRVGLGAALNVSIGVIAMALTMFLNAAFEPLRSVLVRRLMPK